MEENLAEIRDTLKKYGQEHLLNGYDKLNEKDQKKLLNQIRNIDFALISSKSFICVFFADFFTSGIIV